MQSLLCTAFVLIIGIFAGVLAECVATCFVIQIRAKENSLEDTKAAQKDGKRISNPFLLLKGRWSSYGTKASSGHIFVILLNCSLYFIVYMANGLNIKSILYLLMTSAFLVISIVDESTFEIPLPCNLFIGGLGIIMCVYDYRHLIDYLIGFVAISLVLYLLYLLSNGALIGGGDVKLMAAAGLLLGWKKVTLAFFVACILGAIIHSIRMRVSKKEHMLAMGPYLCAALWICTLWGDAMIAWYLGKLVQ